MSDPVRLEAGVQMLAEACPGQSARTWDLLRTVLDEDKNDGVTYVISPGLHKCVGPARLT